MLSVIAVLVATVSFASGLTVPGGFNSSDYGPAGHGNEGMATLVNKTMFQVFIISDTVAMYFSTIEAYVLLWSQMRGFVSSTLRFIEALLQIAVSCLRNVLGIHVCCILSREQNFMALNGSSDYGKHFHDCSLDNFHCLDSPIRNYQSYRPLHLPS